MLWVILLPDKDMETKMNTIQQDILYRYAAKKAIQDLKDGVENDRELLHSLDSFPLKNYCRSEIKEDDKELLKDIVLSKKGPFLCANLH